ncbi:hypothetical protein HIM_09792 [Hirsutella minnesotensis 3608]|uniref:Mcm2 3 5 family protein n=1 Tax=Hirsutella minnesotensis 3608 TaxID=1043627 RepID=A0A0F7ZS67_9HYPO|nr:hypothetical protein HIM_09792 [Hirsutella minnesotensis 3608]
MTSTPDAAGSYEPLHSVFLEDDVDLYPLPSSQAPLSPQIRSSYAEFPMLSSYQPISPIIPRKPVGLGFSNSPASPPEPHGDLGALTRQETFWPRVPEGEGAVGGISPTVTPPLTGNTLGGFSENSPMSSAAASPQVGFISGKGRQRRPPWFQRLREALYNRGKSAQQAEPGQSRITDTPGDVAGERPVSVVSGRRPSIASSEEGLAVGKDQVYIDDDLYDEHRFHKKFAEPPTSCCSKKDIQSKRRSWLSWTILCLSIYSTVGSIIWLVVAFKQPGWGNKISTRGGLRPSTASTISTLLSKTIELSFATVFISCAGQALTRRALARGSRGMKLSEMTMRNWVVQPGSMLTHPETLGSACCSWLGVLSLIATIVAMLFTTASDSMVAPKLKDFTDSNNKRLTGLVRSSYANSEYLKQSCPALFKKDLDPAASESCINVQFSGESYRNLQAFMERWEIFKVNGTQSGNPHELPNRPVGTSMLHGKTMMKGAWIETAHSNVTRLREQHGRLINNVTMAMPHPGVYAAAIAPRNGILQPDDLNGIGEYSFRAGVVSPSINVMCVNMSAGELSPLVYTEWPNSRKNFTGVGTQTKGALGWADDVPRNETLWRNGTVVDDVFRWGPKYGRFPPVFQMFPAKFNMIVNSSSLISDALYLLSRNNFSVDYTLCEMRSWVSPNCSTQFNISGTGGSSMHAHCEDNDDQYSYRRFMEKNPIWDGEWSKPSNDWKKWIAEQWRLSMDINGGTSNNNASNARIITQLALREDRLSSSLPSMAEALAVYAGSTLVLGSIDSTFEHFWAINTTILPSPGMLQDFNVFLTAQQYTSGHTEQWHKAFYLVLVLAAAINILCLIALIYYFYVRGTGLVTDFTELENVFALAINSPPDTRIHGSCGGGPTRQDLQQHWRVSYVEGINHYFFEEARQQEYPKVKVRRRDKSDAQGSSYKRLRLTRFWL